jgi:phytanoyl-CoA hydroxylase
MGCAPAHKGLATAGARSQGRWCNVWANPIETGMLTQSQKTIYRDQGFLVLPGFRSAAAVAGLIARAREIVDAFEPQGPASVFTTHDQARTADATFLASADRIICFFEEEAFGAQGGLRQPKAQSINKIGHALHDLDPVFDRFSRGADMAALAVDLGLAQPQARQSMVIFKPPRIGAEVSWHQDATFLITEPPSVVGFWFALEDATLENGCLWVEPGGHRGPLRQRFIREADGVRMQTLDATPWPDASQSVPLEVAAGTVVCFDGMLPHYSAANRSDRSRVAYTLHATDARCVWSALNWLQRGPGLPLRGLDPDSRDAAAAQSAAHSAPTYRRQ